MKTKKSSKKNFNHSDFNKIDSESLNGKSVKKDKGSKRRLSIYDEFEDEGLDTSIDLNYGDYDDD